MLVVMAIHMSAQYHYDIQIAKQKHTYENIIMKIAGMRKISFIEMNLKMLTCLSLILPIRFLTMGIELGPTFCKIV